MKVSDAILSRRSMRVFKPDPVPEEKIRRIIEVTRRAASNVNLQAWRLYVTMGEARKRLSDAVLASGDARDSSGVPGNSNTLPPSNSCTANLPSMIMNPSGWPPGSFDSKSALKSGSAANDKETISAQPSEIRNKCFIMPAPAVSPQSSPDAAKNPGVIGKRPERLTFNRRTSRVAMFS